MPSVRRRACRVADEPAPKSRRRKRRAIVLLLAAAVLGLGGWLATRNRDANPYSDLETEVVQYGDLPMEIDARGDVEPSETTDLLCHVKALAGSPFATTIKTVVGQGQWVKRGDVVVQLDDAPYQEDLAERRVPLEQARSEWLLAVENQKIVAIQNESDIRCAEDACRLAELDLRKYVEADHEQTRHDLISRLKLVETDLLTAREHLAFTERMRRRGFTSEGQTRAERNRVESVQLSVETALNDLSVLDKYGHPRALADVQGKADVARMAVRLAREQAKCKEVQATSDRLSKQRVYQKRLNRYREIEAEAAKCRITAPHDGVVIHPMSEQTRSGSGSYQAVIAPGEQVREGQKLVRVAQLRRLVVQSWVHEALIGHVHGEADVPSQTRVQKALIQLDAVPNRVLHGHVKLVGAVPAMLNGWMDGSKYFRATISIDEPAEGLQPNMTAQVTILMEEAPRHILTVPLDAILPGLGNHRRLYVMGEEGPRERDVVVGFANDDTAQILAGLEQGEEVVVNPDELTEDRGHHGGGATKHRRARRK
jgi:multidrug efflux pump subunit AcrA (membrane-fusion protein)